MSNGDLNNPSESHFLELPKMILTVLS